MSEASEESVGDLVIRLKGEAGGIFEMMEDALNQTLKLQSVGNQMQAALTTPIQAAAQQMNVLAASTATVQQAIAAVNAKPINPINPLSALDAQRSSALFKQYQDQQRAADQLDAQKSAAFLKQATDQQRAIAQLDAQKAAFFTKRGAEVDHNWEQAALAKQLQEEKAAAQAQEDIRRDALRRQKEIDELSRQQTEEALTMWRSYKDSLKQIQDETAFNEFLKTDKAHNVRKGTWEGGEEDAEGSGGGRHGGMNHYMMRRLGFHAGQAMGMAGVGNDVTGIMVAMEGFGGAIGSAVVGAVALASVMAKIKEETKQLYNTQLDYSAELTKAANTYHAQARDQSPGNTVSKMAFGGANEVLNQQNELLDTNAKSVSDAHDRMLGIIPTMTEFGEHWQRFQNLNKYGMSSTLPTTYENIQDDVYRQANRLQVQQDYLNKVGESHAKNQESRNSIDRYYAEQAATTAVMYENPVKRRLQLEQEIEASRRKLLHDGQDRLSLTQVNGDLARNNAQSAVDTAQHALYAARNDAEKAQAKDRLDRATARQGVIEAQQASIEGSVKKDNAEALVSNDKISYQKRLALLREFDEESNALGYSYTLARITAENTGYAQQIALLRARNAQEHDTRTLHGESTIATDMTAKLNEQAMARDHAHEIEELAAGMSDKWKTATHQASASTIEWQATVRHLSYDLSLTKDEIDKLHVAWQRANQAEANDKILDTVRQLGIELDAATHKITTLQATYAKLRLDNPDASSTVLHQQAEMQEKIRTQQFAHSELSELHPMLKLQDYLREIEAARKSGALSDSDAKDLVNKKEFDLFGHMDSGTFNSSYVKGQVDVSKINQDAQFGKVDRLTEIGRFIQSIENMMKGWEPLK